jgi:HAD superfamily hydrolase (TIGR01549 family)
MLMFNHNIQAIFFDFDGTLRHSEPSSMETFYRFAAEEGYPTTPEQRLRGERWVNAYWAESDELREDVARYGPWQDNGKFWLNHARRHLIAVGSAEAHAESIAARVTQRMRVEYEPVDCVSPDVPPVLQRLREAGFALAVVSNRSHPYDTLVETLKLSSYFEFVMAAGELGTFKPDPMVFHHAAQRAGVEPDQTVYVGDNFHADVLGARAAGMHPVLYDPKGIYPEADCVVIRDIKHLEPLFLACGDDQD